MGKESTLVSICLLTVAVAVLLHLFYIYHGYMLYNGCTSNEYAKRNSLKKFIRVAIKKLNLIHATLDKDARPSKEDLEFLGLT